jgi:glutamine amidotransferase-like uncharacterized protein
MDGHSALAIGLAFQWMGCSVEIVDAEKIKQGSLARCDVLAVPGGESDPDPWRELGSVGKSIIQEFVGAGGGYVGICLGALLASNTCEFWGAKLRVDSLSLDMFSGAARCGQDDVAPKGSWPVMTELTLSTQGHPIAKGLPERMMAVTYPNGPYFEPREDANVTVIAKFGVTGNPAMLAFEYGNGRVFLSGPHPEIDVDSDRDGSSKFDELEDEGSEWPLLLAATKWIVKR